MSTSSRLAAAVTALALSTAFSSDHAKAANAHAAPVKTLTAFRSEKELKKYLSSFPRRFEKIVTVSKTANAAQLETITSTQHAGVDEGDIVKLHGKHLVVLRRGRLFTIDVSEGRLQPVSSVNAFGPGMDPHGAWYDELLVSRNKIVVIGYSHEREGTELGIFDIDGDGRLSYRTTYQIRSNDYYSSGNYAARLIGDKLILYSPLEMPTVDGDEIDGLPAMREWQDAMAERAGASASFVTISTPARIYYMPSQPPRAQVLHSITICDLSTPALSCKATALSGNRSRVFYVSPSAVYLWTGGWRGELLPDGTSKNVPGTLFRMPLDGSAPQAVGVRGTPVDQLSFDETDGGFLNVVARAQWAGDWMGSSAFARGDVELLHLPLADFGDGTRAAPASAYRKLPEPTAGPFHNRFVRGSLLYGSSHAWSVDEVWESRLYIADPESGLTAQLRLPHGVDRIEAMGDDAVVIGSRGDDLHFSGVKLGGAPIRVQHYVMKNAAEGDTRTHGFFYKSATADAGVLALPVLARGEETKVSDGGAVGESASVVFLRNEAGRFDPVGALKSGSPRNLDDKCEVSCHDWYGNARPIFMGGRILAMMGYEIVEGGIDFGALREIRRTTFAPRVQQAAR